MAEGTDVKAGFDPSRAADRRKFFLSRAMRKRTLGSGSDLRGLMDRPRQNDADFADLGGLRVMLIGAHAAAVYAPERNTVDVDIIISPQDVAEAESRLSVRGWTKHTALRFPNANLGLYGSAWRQAPRPDIDLISSDQKWLVEAFAAPPVLNRWNQRVIPLVYLVLMKVDSARNLDQADLSRMLGRLDTHVIEHIVAVVIRHHPDHQIAEEIRQYAEIGRWEYMTEDDMKKDEESGR